MPAGAAQRQMHHLMHQIDYAIDWPHHAQRCQVHRSTNVDASAKIIIHSTHRR